MSTVADQFARKSSRQTSAKQDCLRLVHVDFGSAVTLAFLAAVAIAAITVATLVMI